MSASPTTAGTARPIPPWRRWWCPLPDWCGARVAIDVADHPATERPTDRRGSSPRAGTDRAPGLPRATSCALKMRPSNRGSNPVVVSAKRIRSCMPLEATQVGVVKSISMSDTPGTAVSFVRNARTGTRGSCLRDWRVAGVPDATRRSRARVPSCCPCIPQCIFANGSPASQSRSARIPFACHSLSTSTPSLSKMTRSKGGCWREGTQAA